MEFKANTVLITGGATGIGFALAERFIRAESSVIICGRRKHKSATSGKAGGLICEPLKAVIKP